VVHNNVTGTNVSIVGKMTGGTIKQSAGADWRDLVAALESLRLIAGAKDNPSASLVEAAASQAVSEIHTREPNRNKIGKLLSGIAQVIQTLGELGPAWALVAAEAVKAGIQIALPPGVGH
jgi:hypothetical protein